MKIYSILVILGIVSVIASCQKEHVFPGDKGKGNHIPVTLETRKIRYELYTNENFSAETGNITFSVFMRNSRRTLLDSALTTMKIKDIPDFEHRIIIEKSVPGKDPSLLRVGFLYTIENVGMSWYLEDFSAGDTLKVLRFAFR